MSETPEHYPDDIIRSVWPWAVGVVILGVLAVYGLMTYSHHVLNGAMYR